MYPLLRRIFFFFPAEEVHYFAMNALRLLCSIPFLQAWLARYFKPQVNLTTTQFGLTFRNPVGLGAGFDKNAKYLRELYTLGFGFVEIGTVTPKPQSGNAKPRLFRLPKDKALINRMGFNNDGVDAVVERLKAWRTSSQFPVHHSPLSTATPNSKPQTPNFLIGGNIGKNKTTPNEHAVDDYCICFQALHLYVDFFVVNVSSPNTPGLRELQEKESLRKILTALQSLNKQQAVQRPLLLKIAPDLTEEQLIDVAQLANEIALDGLVATNTTINRDHLHTQQNEVTRIGAGGLSGKPLRERSTQVIRFLRQHTTLPIIGSGGIFTAADAQEKRAAGASLLEVWTGFVYEGPGIVRSVCRGLQQR